MISDNLGNLFYSNTHSSTARGYKIEITDESTQEQSPKGIPDEIDIVAIMASADPKAGEQVFKKCAVCHTSEKGGSNKVGPNLWNIVDSVTAQHQGFAYSNAMNARGKEKKKWSFEELYRYLYSPKKYVTGTKMAFAGIKKDEERANLIAYLATLSDSPKRMPKS